MNNCLCVLCFRCSSANVAHVSVRPPSSPCVHLTNIDDINSQSGAVNLASAESDGPQFSIDRVTSNSVDTSSHTCHVDASSPCPPGGAHSPSLAHPISPERRPISSPLHDDLDLFDVTHQLYN